MNFKNHFPILNNCTYLNTAASGILSQSIQEWRTAHDADFVQRGSKFRLHQAEFIEEVRADVARLFHGKVANTFLIQNFSIAFNTFLDGLSRDHKFLLLSSDYPSVNYPVTCRGFSCAYAALDENLEQNILDQIREFKPTVFAFSMVQYISGIKVSPDFIKKLKTEFPELLIVGDGTQFCGTADFNFGESGLDVLISSGYKWMLSGYGNGFMLIKDRVYADLYQERLQHPLPGEAFLKDKGFLAMCFEPGHLDTLSFGTLQQSVLFFEELGLGFIEQRIKHIGEIAKAAFTERGLLSRASALRTVHAPIFNIPADPVLMQKLEAANLVLSPRGEGLRVSFNFYNDDRDLEQLLAVIDGVRK